MPVYGVREWEAVDILDVNCQDFEVNLGTES
jgi:hypothetical protein